jgi:hypothetical protein
MPRQSKKVGWGQKESRILAALDAEAHVENVTFDEADVESPQIKHDNSNRWSRKKRAAVALSFAAALIIVVTPLAILLPAERTPIDIDQFAKNELPPYSREAAKKNSSSPQAKALRFIHDTSSSSDPPSRLRQRFALAVIYFSTVSLNDEARILDEQDECSWFKHRGLDYILQPTWDGNDSICNEARQYLILVLNGDSVTGTIPAELEMLSSLQYLKLGVKSIRGTLPPQL